MMMRWIIYGVVLAICSLAPGRSFAARPQHHVVLIIWDGMRPDFVTEAATPTLASLAASGVTFENHHPVYPSSTEVNGTALFTGLYPGHSGIIGNAEYRPAINQTRAVNTENPATMAAGDAQTHGHYLAGPTVPEWLRRSGKTTAVAGAKGVALLADRSPRSKLDSPPVFFGGATLPSQLAAFLTGQIGEFPEAVAEKPTRNDWTTSALLTNFWERGVPDFSVLWMNQPDLAQHRTGVGSEHSLAALRNNDENLGRVLAELDRRGVRADTDVLIVSDHGFSTISAVVDVADSLQTAGLDVRRLSGGTQTPGEVVVVGNGGSVMIYVREHREATIRKVVEFLQGWNRTGVIFTRNPIRGAFSLSAVHIDSAEAPDVVLSLRWTAERNDAGAPGMIFSDPSGYGAGQGMHATLSRFDMHNTLIAAGPDFRRGVVDHLPTGNVDIAPTIYRILEVKPPKSLDGRVLSEALTIDGPKIKSFEPRHLEATATNAQGGWKQYLNFTEVNGVDYFDEGNGAQPAVQSP